RRRQRPRRSREVASTGTGRQRKGRMATKGGRAGRRDGQDGQHGKTLGNACMVVSVLALVTARPALAHHSFAAEFDANAPVVLKGTITKMEWINPHSWIHVDVKNPDGTVTEWMVEGGTPNTLFRRGFTREAVKAGMEITVEGYR